VVVNELVFSTRKLEQLRENSINDHVLRFVLKFVSYDFLELVKGGSALSEGGRVEVAVEVHKEFGYHLAVEVELVNGIDDGITDE
jgi:hypothetical protein